MAADDPVVPNPTYMGDIRFFFRNIDAQHMAGMGLNLATYDGVRKHAFLIHFHTAPPIQDMPLGGPMWSANRTKTFTNWVVNGYPVGSATPPAATPGLRAAPPSRVRKNVATLSDDEIQKLKDAFTGLMAKDQDPTDETSYFALAGIHGLPQAYCEHHDDPFNPWHRVYLKVFEDALRSVPGCEDVTLPYWDVSTELPQLLQEPPFASYDLPRDPGALADPPRPGRPGHYFSYTTERNDPATILSNMQGSGVIDDNNASLGQPWGEWNVGGFQQLSIQAHDSGHGSIGNTMGDQNVASFDPVFWFYHCNIDRYFSQWQINHTAKTLSGFESTLSPGADVTWLEPPYDAQVPWATTVAQALEFDIGYDDQLAGAASVSTLENKVGSVEAARSFTIKRESPVSVRVKGIDRLSIPGSFWVHLLADGKPLTKRGFFQPMQPRECTTCVKKPLANIDFRLDQEQILDKKLSVEIEPIGGFAEIGERFPLSRAGNPTINARLLMEDE